MYVIGIGDVRQVTNTTIFYKDAEGKECTKKVNKDDLGLIHGTAWENIVFYDRMYQVLHSLYESRKEEHDKKYKYITDEDIEAEFKANGRSKLWFDITFSKDSHNEECRYQWGLVYGIAEASNVASSKKWEADRIYRGAQAAYQHNAKLHTEVKGNKKVLKEGW